MEDEQWNISAITDWIFFTLETVAKGTKLKLEIASRKTTTKWKLTNNVRRSPMEDDNIKYKILSQQPLIRYSLKFQIKLRGLSLSLSLGDLPKLKFETLAYVTKPKLKIARNEDEQGSNFKTFKMKYLSNHWLDIPENLILCLGDRTNIEICSKWWRHPMAYHLNFKSGISRQSLIRSYWNIKLR